MVNMGELFAHPRILGVPMDRVLLDGLERSRYLLQPGDLLFARQSLVLAGAGKCSIFVGDDEPVTFESHLIRARLDRVAADPDFYYYYFTSPPGRASIRSIVEQVSAAGIRGRDLAKLPVPMPPLETQREVARTLRTLDDRIELNRRMSRTLESIARAIFKSWFVDFDPVRRKMEGGEVGLPPDIAALFPSTFSEAALGAVPSGWGAGEVGDLVELCYGKSLRERDRHAGGVPVFGSNGQIGWHDQALVRGPGVVVGRKGKPGTVTWSEDDFFVIDTAFYASPKRGLGDLHHVFYTLNRLDLQSLTADSAVPGLNRTIASRTAVLIAPLEVSAAFSRIVAPIHAKVASNAREAALLAMTRDALLPELLRGELPIRRGPLG